MHKFHHHYERPWTDSNYGGILSIWDRAFGTFVYGDPRVVVYGVDVDDPARDEDVAHQFALPFRGRSEARPELTAAAGGRLRREDGGRTVPGGPPSPRRSARLYIVSSADGP